MKDKNGKTINLGANVELPDPNDTDIHGYAFVGRVTDILAEKGTLIVEDQDSDFFEIEGNRVEVVHI